MDDDVQRQQRWHVSRSGGVHVTERRLRLALGIDINDSRLIRPADEPSVSLVMFDWWDIVSEALMRAAQSCSGSDSRFVDGNWN